MNPSSRTSQTIKRSPRRRSREFALQGIYQWLLNKEEAAAITEYIQQTQDFKKADASHFAGLVSGTIKQADTLRQHITPLLDRTIEELSPVEHAILLLGAFELSHHMEIPYRVVINEAVELAKSFGGIDGHKYVNGVLDKLASEFRAEEVSANRKK